jgi:hypothetical protein
MTPPGTSSFDRKRRGLSRHLVATAVLFALAGCSGGGDDPSGPFRAVLMADTHVIGPLDRDKAIPLGSCAQTWRYDGDPRPVAGAPETGDCVIGIE